MKKNLTFTLRLSDEDMQKLAEIANFYGENKNACIRHLITAQYDSLCDNPQLKEILEQMNKLRSMVDQLDT